MFKICVVLPPHCGGAVPSPMGRGRNGRTDLSRGSTKRSPPLSRTVFLLGCSLTGHNWAAPLLIDRTSFDVFLFWLCCLLVAMSILAWAPSATILAPGTPATSAILMWAETLFSALLASSGCTSSAPPLPVLTFAQSVQLALHCPACYPQSKTGFPTQTSPLVTTSAFPLPGFPHYHLAFINHVHLGAPHVTLAPCALSK